MTRRGRLFVVLSVAAAGAWAAYSFRHGGLVGVLVAAMRDSDRSLDLLRAYLARWGALAPVVYTLAVVVETVVAPIPGALLYAPGGALFGGALGGTLSLVGNVLGATIACVLARTFGDRLTARLDRSVLARLGTELRARGIWIILLLRVNPLTSSDLVSYAAGLVGVPVWQVAVGTLVGMAPQCYAQSYLAERLMPLLPGSALVIVALGAAYAAVVVWLVVRGAVRK